MTRRGRLYTKRGRYYADLRDYSDVGGKREAMIPPGEKYATRDEDRATRILARRLEQLESRRRGRVAGLVDDPKLSDYARVHLERKRALIKRSTLKRHEIALRSFVDRFSDPRLSEIGARQVADFISSRLSEPGTKGERVKPATVRKELGILANLYEAAKRENVASRNPVLDYPRHEWPRTPYREASYLEPGECYRLIRAAEAVAADPKGRAFDHFGVMVRTMAYTGLRRSECWGLEVGDVDLEDGVIHVRPNRWRELKTRRALRWVPVWPGLRDALAAYLEDRPDGLLFPGRKGMITNLDYTVRKAAGKAGIDRHVTLHTLRHTYAATRIQTTDHGQPVSLWTVARELGHTNVTLLERRYGHLQRRRSRSEVVEYAEARVIPMSEKEMAG